MATYNGGQTQQTNNTIGSNQMNPELPTPTPTPSPGNSKFRGRVVTSYLVTETGEPYTGLILQWMGRLVTTLTGAYEGYFSKTLTVSSKTFRGLNPQNAGPTNGIDPYVDPGDEGIIIDDPMGPGVENQGGSNY